MMCFMRKIRVLFLGVTVLLLLGLTCNQPEELPPEVSLVTLEYDTHKRNGSNWGGTPMIYVCGVTAAFTVVGTAVAGYFYSDRDWEAAATHTAITAVPGFAASLACSWVAKQCFGKPASTH